MGLIHLTTLPRADISLVMGISSLAPPAALMMACSHPIFPDNHITISLARANRDIITPLLLATSVTVIDKELSITQRVCTDEVDSRLRKNQNTNTKNQIIISMPRMARLLGDMMKLIGGVIYLFH
jgi:hypothetical protein